MPDLPNASTTEPEHIPTVDSWHRRMQSGVWEWGYEPSCICGWWSDSVNSIVAAARSAHDHARMSNDSTPVQPTQEGAS